MAYQLKEINAAVAAGPAAFMAQCDLRFHQRIVAAADAIEKNLPTSPVVLLSGPSGSGKTTTSLKLEEELERRGIMTHPIALDHYFVERHPGDVLPTTAEGLVDLESPDLLDWALLSEHFTALEHGQGILVPHFIFSRQLRNPAKAQYVELKENEVAIFEGIHALNPRITSTHPDALRLYIAARSDILDGDQLVFKRTWLRLARRAVRDYNFRGYSVASTLENWANVRRGESSTSPPTAPPPTSSSTPPCPTRWALWPTTPSPSSPPFRRRTHAPPSCLSSSGPWTTLPPSTPRWYPATPSFGSSSAAAITTTKLF